jgi:hypothetical protein
MSGWRRYLRFQAAACLTRAEVGLHLVPHAIGLHGQVREHLQDFGEWAPCSVVLRLWWCAYCVERSVHHAIRAEVSRR